MFTMITRWNKLKKRSESGSAMVELALITPLLILFIGAVFEISRVYYLQNNLEYGAKEAARIGSSVKESTDANFNSKKTIARAELENLIFNSVRIKGVIEEPGQFMIRYLNKAGNEINGIQDNLPFDRQNDPGSIDFVEVEVTYPGSGSGVNKPIPAVFNPANVFQSNVTLMSKAIFKIEGRFQ